MRHIEPTTAKREAKAGLAVDLVLGDQVVQTGDSSIESYIFWDDLQTSAFRALHAIKRANPDKSFNFDIRTMSLLTPAEERARFVLHLKEALPGFDVDRALEAIERQLAKMKLDGPNDDHPNPEAKVPIGSDLVKHMFCHAMADFNSDKR